ncbi:MAG: cytochrome c biogenesis protein [Gemmatimonadota bacterium]|nr:cytochrome c biogenesis protein [Gemmatimonadota bacterium]
MIGVFHFGSVMLYGIAGALLGFSFVRETRQVPVIACGIIALGLCLHAIALAEYTTEWAQLPLEGLGPSLSTLAFLTGVGLLIAATLGQASTVGLVLAPVIAVLTGTAAVVGLVPSGQSLNWFGLHIVFAFIGLVGLTIAFAAGLMYLMQFRELKGKRFGAVFRFFPPLDTLDRLGQRGLLLGFPFLTLALMLGLAWMSSTTNPSIPSPAPAKLVWAFMSWVVLLTAIMARAGGGRRGERGAFVSVVGFLVVVAVYLIVRAGASQQGVFL